MIFNATTRQGPICEATHDAVVCHPCRAGFLDTRSITPLDLKREMYELLL